MAAHFTVHRGETSGVLSFVIERGLASDIAGASAALAVRNASGQTILTGGAVAISTVTTAPDGTKGATFTHNLTPESAGIAGTYWAQVTVTYPSGSVQIVPELDGDLTYLVIEDYAELSAAEEETVVQGDLQTQAAHGFAVKDVVRVDSGTWSKARANADATLGMGIVLSVPSTSQFRVAYFFPREVTLASHGLGSAGAKLYLSQGTAGATVTSEPASGIVQWWGVVKDANTLILLNPEVEIA